MDRKPIFDTLRRLLRRPIKQSEVSALDAAIDTALEGSNVVPESPSAPEVKLTPSRTSDWAVLNLIKAFEGCAKKRRDGRFEAYPDPGTGADPWTIGWGSTGNDPFHPGRIGRGTIWTLEQVEEHFAKHLKAYESDVRTALGRALAATSQEQFDAMVSFHYNTGAIHRATLTRKHIAGDFVGAAAEFKRWNKAGGRVLRGLTRRREAEAAHYRSGS